MTPAPFELPADHPDFLKRLHWDYNHEAVVCSDCVDTDPRTCRNHGAHVPYDTYRCAADQWFVQVCEAARPFRRDYPATLIDLAIERLSRCDLSRTRFGIRVALHPEYDNRGEADAYWPTKPGGCRCWSYKSRGECSHDVAASIFELAFPPRDE